MKKRRNQQNRRGASSSPAASSSRAARGGASVVEFALVLPLFLVLVFGIIEFGRAMQVSQLVTNVAREGARRAVLPGSTNTGVEKFIKDFLKETLNVDGASVTITITVTPASGTGIPGSTLADAQPGDEVKVRDRLRRIVGIRDCHLDDVVQVNTHKIGDADGPGQLPLFVPAVG